jgi:predicted metal-dependent phosphoesterase TrpH
MAHIDLHLHSTFSDGRDTVARLAERAYAEDGLVAIGLTDHDTGEGVDLLRAAAPAAAPAGRAPLKIIDGIEISADWNGAVMHLLGYFPPGGATRAERVRALCWDNVAKHRVASIVEWAPAAVAERMRRRRRELIGEDVTFDTAAVIAEVRANYEASVAGAARALGHAPRWPVPPGGRLWRETMERHGLATLPVLEAFVARDGRKAALLVAFWEDMFAARKGRPPSAEERARIADAAREDCGFILYGERSSIGIADAVAAVRDDGGISVLAHGAPTLRAAGVPSLERALGDLAALGVQGFEAYYPLHTDEETACMLRFCAARGLYVTGGTDHHGKKENRVGELGGGRRVPLLPIVDLLGA